MRQPTRPHVAARVEDGFHRRFGRWLRGRGWSPLVTKSTGYADHDGVHVFVRVLLGRLSPVTVLPATAGGGRGRRDALGRHADGAR